MTRTFISALGLAVILAGCGDPDPRYGEASVSQGAPRVALSGTTFGQAAALELAPGCPGYLDVEQPGHVVHVQDDVPFTIQVRSDDGPLALAVASGDEVRCDSDEGSGHAPTLTFEGAGDYQVFVAALRQPAELSYELTAEAAGGAGGGPAVAEASAREVSVTITSDPSGAQVRDAEGNVVGTTPSMFVLSLDEDQVGQERAWTLALEGHEEARVAGTVSAGALVLHAQLPRLGPTRIDVHAASSLPIRDYQSASQVVNVAQSCAITEAEAEVDIRHSFIGDLRLVLETPWGEEITLHRHGGGGRRNLRRTFTSERDLSALVGRPSRGQWTMTVHDDAGADTGSFERFDLRLVCSPDGVATAPASPATGPTPASTQRPRPDLSPFAGGGGGGGGSGVQAGLPDLPTRTEIVRVLGALRPNAERCSAGHGGSVRVMLTVNGSSGRVSHVSSSGTAAGAERACVERVVRAARFSRFRRASLDVDYTYNLPRQAARPTPTRGGEVLNPWN